MGQLRRSHPALVLVGPLPPPHHGQSVAFEMVVEGCRERGISHTVVDLSHSERTAGLVGQATWGRVVDYMGILWRYSRAVAARRGTVYLTIAQSPHGFLRDAVMIVLARLFGHRVVCHLHGGNYGEFFAAQPGWLQRCIRRALLASERLLVLGERIRAAFNFEPRLAERIAVVPNGLPIRDLPRTEPKILPERGGGGKVQILYLSNLVESKGYLELLHAIALLRERYGIDDLFCHFCGIFLANPPDDVRVRSAEQARELFERSVRELGLEHHVRFHGPVTGADKAAMLEQAHVFVLPTHYNNEGQPISIIEAMAFGAVVVSTDYRAIPDMVQDGVTGRLVPSRDPEAIAEALHELIRDPERYRAMSRAAVRRVEEDFTWDAHLDALLAHLLGRDARQESRA